MTDILLFILEKEIKKRGSKRGNGIGKMGVLDWNRINWVKVNFEKILFRCLRE